MHEATWWVTFYPDYPTENGLHHAYFANADCGTAMMRLRLISSHIADSCMIDHEARISDITIPDSIKVELAVQHWMDSKINS